MKDKQNNVMYYKPVYHEEFPIGAYFKQKYNANINTIRFGGPYGFDVCKEYLDNKDAICSDALSKNTKCGRCC